MTATTRQPESTAVVSVYAALDLGNATWRVATTTDRRDPVRHYAVPAGDVQTLLAKLERARVLWGLPDGTPVRTCYEAGRDGFWLHRCLTQSGVTNWILDATSLQPDGRAKQVKTDRVDAERLLDLLLEGHAGRKKLRVVRVPSVAQEDGRHPDRELSSAKGVRTTITNRITGLLIAQGIRLSPNAVRHQDLRELRLWDGTPLPEQLHARLVREREALTQVGARIARLECERRAALDAQTPAAQAMARLMTLAGLGINGASRLVLEGLVWRAFTNGRQVGAFAGLTPTPHQSGTMCREQGISKAGNARLRTMVLELAWCWVRFQPDSELTQWFRRRFGGGSARHRRVGIVALARKLLIALWRFAETGEIPAGAVLKAAA